MEPTPHSAHPGGASMARAGIAIRRRCVETVARPDVLVVFPFDGSITRHSLSSTGSPQGRIPLLHRYYGMLRLPIARPDALRLPSLAGTTRHGRFAPLGGPWSTGGQGFLPLAPLSPMRLFPNGNDRASQVPGEPLWACPVLRPRRDLRARPLRRVGAAFRFSYSVGSRNFASFEARWHGPPTRCLRFAGRITPPPRKTRFRLLATLCRTGCCLLQGPNERFQPCLTTSHPPFPSFLDANETKRSESVASRPAAHWSERRARAR
jgi:hypothetical protein